LRIHSVGGGKGLALMYAEEGARTLSVWVFDRRERLFDELAARNLSIGKKLRKLDDRCQCVSPLYGMQKAHSITPSTRAVSRGASDLGQRNQSIRCYT